MRIFLGLALVAACPAMAAESVDTFETDANANGWIWVNDLGQVRGVVQPSGGNPDGWFDSEDLFFNDHPEVIGTAPDGSKLRAALASGALLTARIAALCMQHGVRELLSADRDFSRFPQIAVRNPLIAV